MSQKSDIIAALQNGDKLSRLDCLNRFGCIEAGARITELRHDGYPIETETIYWETMKGEKKSRAQWSLNKTGQLSFGV